MAELKAGNPKVVDVGFQNKSLPEPLAVVATDASGAAPRRSRHIDFVDDGKFFEGHLTVQSRSLKSIIQYLVDQHAEQAVIVRDLQDQVSTLRTKVSKSSRSGGGFHRAGAGAGASPMELEEMNKRMKRMESFMLLWGTRPEDVDELVQSYGDPVVTPEQYTSYLLDLPCFRLTRREARALVAASAATGTVGVGGMAGTASGTVAQDTAARRRSQSQGIRASATGGEDKSAPSAGESERAKTALDGVSDALRRIEALERRQGDSPVDTQARQDIEDLGDFVTHRLQELESRMMLAAAAGGANSGKQTQPTSTASYRSATRSLAERRASKASAQNAVRTAEAPSAPADDAEGPADAESATRTQPQQSQPEQQQPQSPPVSRTSSSKHGRNEKQPRGRRASSSPATQQNNANRGGASSTDGPAVDSVAREDAAMSLELIEMLEANVEKRFRELSTQMANIALRQGAASSAAAVNSNSSGGGGANAAAGEEKPVATTTRAGSKVRGRREAPPKATLPPQSAQSIAPATVAAAGPTVDQAAREEVSALAERLADFEDDLGKRWQALEERLRIIGRASMNRAVAPNANGGASVDRKAREDASLSLMRVQQMERELGQLRRQLAAILAARDGGADTATLAAAGALDGAGSDGPMRAGAGLTSGPAPPPANLRDTYTSKIDDLEREVEQRMTEVNRAIALLKAHDDSLGSAVAAGGAVPPALQSALMLAAATAPPPPRETPAQAQAAAAAAAPPSTIVLRSGEDAEENPPTPPPPASVNANPSRHTASLSVLQLNSNLAAQAGGTTPPTAGLPAASIPRRLTVSRLRAPDAPVFGSRLVVRDAVTDEELEAILEMMQNTSEGGGGQQSYAGALAADAPDNAGKGSFEEGVNGDRRTKTEGGASSRQHQQLHEASEGRSAAVAAVVAAPAALPLREVGGASAIGHTTPCVVLDCAWCASERGDGKPPRLAQV